MKVNFTIRIISVVAAGCLLGLVFSNFKAGACFGAAVSSIYTVVISKVIR